MHKNILIIDESYNRYQRPTTSTSTSTTSRTTTPTTTTAHRTTTYSTTTSTSTPCRPTTQGENNWSYFLSAINKFQTAFDDVFLQILLIKETSRWLQFLGENVDLMLSWLQQQWLTIYHFIHPTERGSYNYFRPYQFYQLQQQQQRQQSQISWSDWSECDRECKCGGYSRRTRQRLCDGNM